MSCADTTRKQAEDQEWSRFDAVTDEQRHAAALADPDSQPWTEEQLRNAKRVVHVLLIRRRLKLTQEEFAEQFEIPIGTLRDWEQRRKEPDTAAKAYLRVINVDPDAVRKALSASRIGPRALEASK